MAKGKIRVAAYTGGINIASARFRVRQYVPALDVVGVNVTEYASVAGQYPPTARWARPFWFAANLSEGVMHAPGSYPYDVTLFQRELLSTFMTTEPLYARPRVLDVDDAIWLHPRGAFALRLARLCDTVICGNDFLADYFSASGSNIEILPTAVDTERFHPVPQRKGRAPVMGWSGSSGNLPFLEATEGALAIVMKRFTDARVRVICDRPPNFLCVPADRVDYVPWSPEVEVSQLQDLTVGLMPLPDTEWARGKCAFKMLTYMACGVPVVVSPVGMNAQVLAQGEIGYGAQDEDGWVDALSHLLADRDAAAALGANGRCVIEAQYSVQALAPRFAEILQEVARK